MKAESIIKIEAILKQRKQNEHASYKNIQSNLKQKYDSDWYINYISPSEKIMLHRQKELRDEADTLYEDFMNHNW